MVIGCCDGCEVIGGSFVCAGIEVLGAGRIRGGQWEALYFKRVSIYNGVYGVGTYSRNFVGREQKQRRLLC
jgi:hypothetical protein